MRPNLKNFFTVSGGLLSLLVIWAFACILAAKWVLKPQDPSTPFDHHWVHEQLELEDGDFPALENLEETYSENRMKLMGEMKVLQANLATLLLDKSRADDEVNKSVEEIHQIHGELQKLSIRHYFDMIDILPPEKALKLRELAVESLSAPRH